MSQSTYSIPTRVAALLLTVLVATLGCRPTGTLDPIAGAPDYQAINFIPVPGGRVNAAGGNLLVRRIDMSIDTLLGTQEIAASYNSANGEWLWNFQIHYDGLEFVDPSGAVHTTAALADGEAIAGSIWRKAGSTSVETRGGLAYHFTPAGNLDHVRWATLDYPRIRYLPSVVGGIDTLAIEQCTSSSACAALFEIELNESGDPLSVEDARTGRRTEYQYDAGRLVGVRDPLAIEQGWDGTSYEYELMFPTLLAAIVNSEGERIEYAYQTNRRIVDVVQIGEGNPTHHFEFHSPRSYTDDNYVTFHTNPLGGVTRYWIDAQRRVVDIHRPAAAESRQIVWSGLRPSAVTAASGATTYLSYSDDDLAQIVEPSGNIVTITPEVGGLNHEDPHVRAIARVEDSLGLIALRTYDPEGRLLTSSNGAGETTEQIWSPIALASTTNPSGATFGFPVYGAHGHWLEMDGAGTDRRSIDPVGNILIPSTGRHRGGILTREFDPNRNVDALTVAASANGSVTSQDAISIQRRSDAALLYVSRPGGGDHRFVYDALGRPVRRDEFVDGTWQSTLFEYDLAGNTKAVTRPNGMREEYDYDAYSRVIAHRASIDGSPQGEETFVYQDGLLVSRTDSIRGSTEVYSYDAAGRLAVVTFGFGETVVGEYDERSRLVAETLSSPSHGLSRRIEYDYDGANRVTRLGLDDGELLASWTIEGGLVQQIEYGNGLTRTFENDPATGSMTSASTQNELGLVVENTMVETTIETGPAREQIRSSTASTIAQTVERYSMSRGGHLASPDGYVGQRVFAWEDESSGMRAFDYDELSNQVSNASGDTFLYNAERNRLISATLYDEGSTLDYTYDEAGFATSRGGVPITWTATGRMASFGADSITWDMQGRPVARSIGGEVVEFEYFGGRVANDPQTGALLPLDLGVAVVSFDSAGRTFRHFDFRNNVSFVSDESGAITGHYQYSPYGLEAAYGSSNDDVHFAGRQQVGELMWLGARVYDPKIGRFLSPDPVFDLVNQFTYTLGNPIRYWDPDGQRALSTSESNVIKGAVLALTAGALAGCVPCGWWALVLSVLLYIDGVANGAIGPVSSGRPVRSGAGDISVGLGSLNGAAPPACGLLGIEPFLLIASMRRLRRRRRLSPNERRKT